MSVEAVTFCSIDIMDTTGFYKGVKMINGQDFFVFFASAYALGGSNDFITAAGCR